MTRVAVDSRITEQVKQNANWVFLTKKKMEENLAPDLRIKLSNNKPNVERICECKKRALSSEL
jgi:hypothetical protein